MLGYTHKGFVMQFYQQRCNSIQIMKINLESNLKLWLRVLNNCFVF